MKIPPPQSCGMYGGGGASLPEGPGGVHDVEVFWSLAEAEYRERGAKVSTDLWPVAGIHHELSVGEGRQDLKQEVFDTFAAKLEHAVGGTEELVVDDLVFRHSRYEGSGGNLVFGNFITEWFKIAVDHKLITSTIWLFTLDKVFKCLTNCLLVVRPLIVLFNISILFRS